ncbi:signal peptidase I [Sphingorhabdus sp. Alg239-R122]|uniref:signal peptidase I n=1 Tax=Sphingorhabdus sp. Alg239-R122 TaxID=2305989 RepID=UPI0023DDE56A|nr:signal peptidase I [Sphingorhabdus sp. Alg239-R122]
MSEHDKMANETQGTGTKNKADAASEWADFGKFLVKLVIFMIILRSFIVSPFNIPSESMQPRLVNGDYLLVAKWPYGYSKYSLPFSIPLIPGRIFESEPEAGDVVVFKAPPTNSDDYIKRVIGLPGDTVQMQEGQLILNGTPVPKERVGDFIIAVSPNTACRDIRFADRNEEGEAICRYPQYRETLPNGKSYNVLDLGSNPADNTPPVIVPEGHMFLMGDNRDNSLDSRFPATPGGGIGIVPQANLVGRAQVSVFSVDGSASLNPITWFTAPRWERIGEGF